MWELKKYYSRRKASLVSMYIYIWWKSDFPEWFIAVDSIVGLDEFMAFYTVQAVELSMI